MAFSKSDLIPVGGGNGKTLFLYSSSADAIATVVAADYFLGAYRQVGAGDYIMVQASDDDQLLRVSASSSTTVTTAAVLTT